MPLLFDELFTCPNCGVVFQSKIVGTLEGGYNLEWIGKCLVSIIGQMLNNQVNFNESVDEYEDVDETIKQIKNKIDIFWDI